MNYTVNLLSFAVKPMVIGLLVVGAEGELKVDKVEAETIRLHLHGNKGDQGFDGESIWSCTRLSKDEGHGWGKEQLVFVQQEPTHYKHKVVIKGGNRELSRNTTVFVIPANNTHHIDIQTDTSTLQEPHKPSFFFLKNNPLESESVRVTVSNSNFNYTNPI